MDTYLDVPKLIFLENTGMNSLKVSTLRFVRKKCNLVSNFASQSCVLFSLFSVHSSAFGQKPTDAGAVELYQQPDSHKKVIHVFGIYF